MRWFFIGFLLILIGIFIIMRGMLYEVYKTPKEGDKMRGGGLIMVGPLPIAFGTDIASLKVIMILAIVLMVFALIIMLFPF